MQFPRFDNAFLRAMPGDPEPRNAVRQVEGALWSAVAPTPVAAPRVLAHSREMAQELGFSEADIASPEFARVFGGNALAPGMQPFASNYGGHQFGHWAGQLGDGRAISLGEAVLADGQRRELQLKGAGLTPYSRSADGRAVLRSSIREFLCSEAMHHLGIPTTRALSLVATGEDVVRAVRAEIWGNADDALDGLPLGVAFAAFALGFIGGDEQAAVRTAGPWMRVSLSRGHVLSRSTTRAGLTPVRMTGTARP